MKDNNQEKLWLTAHALGLSTTQILARKEFSQNEIEKINSLISRREAGEPLQYIMGEADFYGRDFIVGEGVLIPRHDTETLIEGVKKYFAPEEKFSFLDFGTGSGCIAITILLEFKNSFAYMIEKSDKALTFAKKNLERYGFTPPTFQATSPQTERQYPLAKGRCQLVDREVKKTTIDLIISNPPYISSGEISKLDRTVKDFEPSMALDGGTDGTDFYKMILSMAMKILKSKGYIIFEMGNLNQINIVKNFSDDFVFVDEIFDTGNFPRCLILRRRD
ncbi:MAG: peptide chain release factor N(5)-glutamine methyltransferase [Synergistaceae bacterium]|nr:peptide chain release factor N(5)-glutamine methyltransferase [Synergistaceae bacterium]